MANAWQLYLFGDQTFDAQPHLHHLLRHRSNPVLDRFLVQAYEAIRREVPSLPPALRDELPRFTCLDDVLARPPSGRRCVPLDMAVTCMYQLGSFMSQGDPLASASGDQTRVLGLCTGSLAAAAVSCSRSSLELVPLAVHAVTLAFRTGLRVVDLAQRLEPSSGTEHSWSIAVPGLVAAEAAIETFSQQTLLPLTRKPFISASTPTGITVSAPPRSLAQLIASTAFKDLRSQRLAIHGPYHAPHLYSQHDVDELVASCIAPGSATASPVRIPLISSSGITIERGDFEALAKDAIGQILLQPIRWAGILDELQRALRASAPSSFRVIPIGTRADQLIHATLKQTALRHLVPSAPAAADESRAAEEGTAPAPAQAKLAIIGMSGRFPGAKDNEAFWKLLYQGLDVHKPVPPLRWDADTHVDITGERKNTGQTPFGCWLDDAAAFDARFFNISPREAPQIDPAQRIALMTAYEALEQAGIVPDATPSTRRDRVGVFYGVTSNDWMETNSAQDIDTYFIPGGNRAFVPGRINYFFKFSGPSYAIDTACSSSLAGIHIACNALWRGDIDTAIAGGTNVLTNPDFTAGLDRGHFLSRTGNCKTFDDAADGYCRGEGVGTVIIKRLDDAISDNDPILGVILGASTNHSAESESITRPHVGAQREIFSKILHQSAVDPYDVSYVEMHGTGTQAGDAGEMSSVLDTFAPPSDQVQRLRTGEEALYLGSAKANIGHGEAASGVSSLIKVLLMMQRNIIVPHCGIKNKINHRFPTDLEERNVNIALEPTHWESADPSKPRRVFVNNFSAAGGNSAVLLEDAPAIDEALDTTADPRGSQLVAVSAKNGASLQGNLRSMLSYLRQNPDISLGKVSYTTTARRTHHPHRVLITGARVEEVLTQMESALRDHSGMTRPKSAPKVIFAFTGQGAQYPGMGKELFERFSLFRQEVRRLDQIGYSLGFPSVLDLIQSEEHDISAFEPITVQLASICIQIALSKLWISWNIKPIAAVGHSLGEYAALCVAGVLSEADTIYLVGKRAQLLQNQCTRDTHAMLVVKGSVEEVSRALSGKTYEISCINSPMETVLAGLREEIAVLQNVLGDAGLKTTLLKVPYAFHSSQMDPILEDFQTLAGGAMFFMAKIPIISPLDGTIIDSTGDLNPEYLTRHSREPVNMLKALETARGTKLLTDQTATLEIGPHPAVSGMVRAVLGPQITSLSSLQRGRPTFQVLASTLKALYTSGANIDWVMYHADFKASHEVVSLPAYSWDLKDYWMQYVNDWSLRKGEPPQIISDGPKIESTTIHRIVEETGDSQKGSIVVEADIARKDLSPLVQGHEVDGIPLCTPSVYADIALSLGTYLLQRYHPEQEENLVDVGDMTISKALILRSGAAKQLIQAHADFDWSSNSSTIKFMSFDTHDRLQEHSRCVIRFKDRQLLETLNEDAVKVKQRIQALRDGIVTAESARFNRPMVYRAIRPLARFHDDYRAIDEILLNSNTLEASSYLSFGSVKREGSFNTHPAIIDALTQICGFTMNCNDFTDLDVEVYMNHGWGSFQIFEPIDYDKTYVTYTRMKEGDDKLWHGNVVVLDGDKVVAYFGKLAIQAVPRRVLKVVLSLESGSKSQSLQPAKPSASISTKPAAAPANTDTNGSKAAQALSIISEESGLALADLTDTTVFTDVGIDSLLGLTISARFKEELDVDMDFGALFFECPSIGELKTFLGASDNGFASASSGSSEESSETGATTPREEDLSGSKVDFERALEIINAESGVAIEDLTEDTVFADSGVDSLLSLVIASRFRDELGLAIQHETFFLECPTVGDLKKLVVENTDLEEPVQPEVASQLNCTLATKTEKTLVEEEATSAELDSNRTALAVRKKAVDDYVQRYTAGFSVHAPSTRSGTSGRIAKVVLITGASGSLGGHLVDQIAQMDDVKTVVCLNREKNMEPYERQKKAMRDKGIRSFDKIRAKLLVLQTDSAKPMFGLPTEEYNELTGSVTHVIHNAWPMSAKRALDGFESQFQVMRNLIDLAAAAAARRPTGFKFSFEMISSIGVVGHYRLGRDDAKTVVPEERVDIESVLPNGYGDAKWGCERMLDETLHKHPEHFRVMTVRLGQIAGSKTSGYWNPMEHFGFLIKSSQTLKALPDVGGTVYWTPVNDVASACADLVLGDHTPYPFYHIENPVGQAWSETNAVLADALKIPASIPFEEWVDKVRTAPQRNNPASTLLEFLDSNYLRMSCGGLVLDTQHTLEHSKTLRAVGPVSEEVVRKYIHVWKEIGFLK